MFLRTVLILNLFIYLGVCMDHNLSEYEKQLEDQVNDFDLMKAISEFYDVGLV